MRNERHGEEEEEGGGHAGVTEGVGGSGGGGCVCVGGSDKHQVGETPLKREAGLRDPVSCLAED